MGAAHRCRILTSQKKRREKSFWKKKIRVEPHQSFTWLQRMPRWMLRGGRLRQGAPRSQGMPEGNRAPSFSCVPPAPLCHRPDSAFGRRSPQRHGERKKKKPKVVKCGAAERKPPGEPRDADLQGQRQASSTAQMPRSTSCLWKTAPQGTRGSNVPSVPLFWPGQRSARC